MIKALISKYKSLGDPVKASAWFLVCGFVQKAIAMLTTPIFTRIMTEEAYGQYSVYNSWLQIISILVSLNLAAGVYTKGLIKYEEEQEKFTSSMLGLSTTCVLVGFIVYLFFHKQINSWLDLTTPLMVAMFIEIWGNSCYQFWSNKERVNYRYKKLLLVTPIYVFLGPILGVICVLKSSIEKQMEARVFSLVAVGTVIFSILFISMMYKGKNYFDKNVWLYALRFNLPLVPHYLSQIILGLSDRVMINSMCGSAEAAYYSVAYSLSVVMLIFNNAVSGSMNPWIYRCIKNGKENEIGKVSYVILGVIALLNFVVIAVAPEIMAIMAPESYSVGVWVIPPLAIGVFFTFLYNLFATFEYYYEKTVFVMIASCSGAILNLITNYVFIKQFGFIAAGYTSLVCYIFYASAHYLFMRKINREFMDGKKVYNIGVIIGIGLVLMIASVVMLLLYDFAVIRYSILTVVVLIVVLCRKKIISMFKLIKR